MKKLQVICFYWEGERWPTTINENTSSMDPQYRRMVQRAGPVSTKLSSKYVNNLFAGVTKYADREFDFICFTNEKLDLDPGIEIRPFKMVTERGVLPRVYMFSEESGLFGHQVLCIDLDVVIVGDLKPLMSYSGLFCARSKFKVGEQGKLDGDIMSFRAGPEVEARFWLPFIANVDYAVALTQGRERYWVRHVANDIADRWDKLSPGAVLSYKRHVMHTGKVPDRASIVSFHGFPRPHQAKTNWIKNYWA